MKNKINTITERVSQDSIPTATLPNGFYYGEYCGFIIKLIYKGKNYELVTEKGVKGFGFDVVVEINDNIATFDILNNFTN